MTRAIASHPSANRLVELTVSVALAMAVGAAPLQVKPIDIDALIA